VSKAAWVLPHTGISTFHILRYSYVFRRYVAVLRQILRCTFFRCIHSPLTGDSQAAPQLKRLVAGFPSRRPGFDPMSSQVGFVVDKVALGQAFSEYFGFPCQSSFHQLLHNHSHLSSGAGTIGQKWPRYKGLSPTPLAIKKYIYIYT
jgi:hypothetical protein